MTKPAYNTYYVTTHNDPRSYMSGRHLPDPDKGPYHFDKCSFHPRVWEALQQMYQLSVFTNCNWSPTR